MDDMSRVRTYIVGRDDTCDVRLDVRLDAPSVSRRHAEVVRVEAGRIHVADCATTNGTFVLADREWRPIGQALVEPADRLRFGEYEMTVTRFDALCRGGGAGPSDGERSGSAGARATPPPAEDELDPTHGLEFEPETGQVVEKPPPGTPAVRRTYR